MPGARVISNRFVPDVRIEAFEAIAEERDYQHDRWAEGYLDHGTGPDDRAATAARHQRPSAST